MLTAKAIAAWYRVPNTQTNTWTALMLTLRMSFSVSTSCGDIFSELSSCMEGTCWWKVWDQMFVLGVTCFLCCAPKDCGVHLLSVSIGHKVPISSVMFLQFHFRQIGIQYTDKVCITDNCWPQDSVV